MADLGDAIGGALGGLFGGLSGLASTQAGVSAVGTLTDTGAAQVAPYNFTGANYLAPAASELVGDAPGSNFIGQNRIDAPSYATDADPVNFENFAANYNESEGAQYLQKTAAAAQDSTAASKGGLLSGSNLRAQTGIAEGIANQDLIQQYQSMAAGQQQGWSQNQQSEQQDFTQREQSYQNMYGQESMGLQAGTAEAGTYAQGARSIGSLYQGLTSSATSSGNSFGSALSSVFGAIAGLF